MAASTLRIRFWRRRTPTASRQGVVEKKIARHGIGNTVVPSGVWLLGLADKLRMIATVQRSKRFARQSRVASAVTIGNKGHREGAGPMATYTRDIDWKLANGEDFPRGRYSRGHTLTFDGGTVVPASASPHEVGKSAVKEAVDPEEMLVAALSNCHTLSFLHVARLAGFTVAAYHDHAEGVMEEIAPGKEAITKVVLRPKIEWVGEAPEQAKLDHMHNEAHEVCFIANSVKTEVTVA
jgi:organic hydroperoxide reductase OsmC/OhrA